MGKLSSFKGFRLFAFVLVAFAQLIPSGFAVSTSSDGLSIVICTADGAQSVSWAEYFGEDLQEQPAPDTGEHNPCHACISSCRIGALAESGQTGHSHPTLRYQFFKEPELVALRVPSLIAPPMPSRSPPIIVQ